MAETAHFGEMQQEIRDIIPVAATILQGLLASGQYTVPAAEKGDSVLARVDGGEKSSSCYAVMDAVFLAKELIDEVTVEAEEGSLPQLPEFCSDCGCLLTEENRADLGPAQM